MAPKNEYIQLYKSSLCPRCRMVERYLCNELINFPNVTLYTFDVLRHPLVSLRKKIRMIPTLITDDDSRLSGFMLSRDQIRSFLEDNFTQGK